MEVGRILEFDAAHRLIDHEGKCKYLHGHRYKVALYVEAAELDSVGRVIDFSVIKEKFGKWIDERLDHNTILNQDDPLRKEILAYCKPPGPYLMKGNPTAELIAKELLWIARELLKDSPVVITRIVVFETPNCFVECGIEEAPPL